MEEKRKIWVRMGVTLTGTREEIDKLINEGEFGTMLDEGNWVFDGDSYIPDDSIDVYNNEYGENYIVKDIEV